MTVTATQGWRRRAPGAYDRGTYSIRREPDPQRPGRPWVLYRATTDPERPAWVGRFHTLRNAQAAAHRGGV